MITKPMRGCDASEELHRIKYPLYATPKYDGIRCIVHRTHGPVSRTFKRIPNEHIYKTIGGFFRQTRHDWDGEITIDGATFQQITSAVMSREGKPTFIYNVFDCVFEYNETPYIERRMLLATLNNSAPIGVWMRTVQTQFIRNADELLHYEAECLAAGYEGVMLRSMTGIYKCGKSTMNEQYLMKLKRFKDSEAVIVGFEELQHNMNRTSLDNFGLTERSHSIANQLAGGTLGALVVHGVNGQFKNVTFNIGSGFSQAQRQEIWDNQSKWIGRTVTYKYQQTGSKDRPRLPIYKSERKD